MGLEVIGNEITDTEIRILKENSCPSLSERSTLTYHIGCTAEADFLLRVDANSGTGKFNRQWIQLNTILELIAACDKPFSWAVLSPVFKNQSVNTAGFMMAVLKQEGLVQPLGRRYERLDPEPFLTQMRKMIKPTKKKAAPAPTSKGAEQ